MLDHHSLSFDFIEFFLAIFVSSQAPSHVCAVARAEWQLLGELAGVPVIEARYRSKWDTSASDWNGWGSVTFSHSGEMMTQKTASGSEAHEWHVRSSAQEEWGNVLGLHGVFFW